MLYPQFEVEGRKNSGRVDYANGAYEDLIYITEGKQHDIATCGSAFEINERKRKRGIEEEEEEGNVYIYGIVATATHWYFLRFTQKAEVKVQLLSGCLSQL